MPKETVLTAGYRALKANERERCSRLFAELLLAVCRVGRSVLADECTRLPLVSLVTGKDYYAFQRAEPPSTHRQVTRISRPVNAGLYIDNEEEFERVLPHFLQGEYTEIGAVETTRLLYTLSMAFCAANDVLATGDKKTPATFFEQLIAHLFARQFQVLPTKKVRVPAADDVMIDLPTDLIFDGGTNRYKFHVPVKLSTRERVIQAWAHQKVIEGLWGTGAFKGLLVVLTETKLSLSNHQVVEICLPNQWRVYQRYIAHIERVYYLDIPPAYAALSQGHPRIEVKPLGAFFFETNDLLQR